MHRHLLDLSLAASIFFVTACDDSIRTNYATAAAAHAVGAIQRGWLPPSLPDSAFDIVESHVLDTNTGGGSFHFAPHDADSFRAQLESVSTEKVQTKVSDRTSLQRDGYTFHTEPGFLLAVNWQMGSVRFWLTPKTE